MTASERTATSVGLAAALAGFGVLYGISAYAVGPAALPVVVAAVAAVAVGLWRLEYGLALLLLLKPFAENESSALSFNPGDPSLRSMLLVWVAILVTIMLARLLVSGRRLPAPPALPAVLLFVMAALLAIPVSEDQSSAASKLLSLLGSVSVYFLVFFVADDWRKLKPILGAIVVSGLAISLHSISQNEAGLLSQIGLVSTGGTADVRVSSTFAHPNQLAGFLVIMVAVGIGLVGVPAFRWARSGGAALAGLALIGILLTYSRAALLAVIALAFVYLATRRAWPVILGGAIAVILLAPSAWSDRVAGIGDRSSPEIATRLDFWDASLAMFAQEPVTGVGLDGYHDAYIDLERTGRTYLAHAPFTAPDDAHNLYLNVLAEQGLVGIAALAFLILAFARMTVLLLRSVLPWKRAIGRLLLGIGVVVIVHNAFDLTVVDRKSSVFVWALLGVGAAVSRMERGPDPP
jgi:O-antigen ligase